MVLLARPRTGSLLGKFKPADRIVHEFLMHHHSNHSEPAAPFAPEMLDHLPVQTALIDGSGTIVYANRAWRTFAGRELLFQPGSAYLAQWPDQGLSAVSRELRERLHRLLQGDADFPATEACCQGEGGETLLEVRMAAVSHGGARCAVVTHLELTRRKRLERTALDDAWRFMEASGAEACLAVDAQWRVTRIDAASEHLFHRNAQDLLGRNIWEEFPEAVGTDSWKIAQDAMERRVTAVLPLCSGPDGNMLEIRLFPNSEGLSAFFRDITPWLRSEQKLRKGEEFFHNAFHSSYIGTAILGLDGQILQVNSSFCELLG